jgi:hypothetical protein
VRYFQRLATLSKLDEPNFSCKPHFLLLNQLIAKP